MSTLTSLEITNYIEQLNSNAINGNDLANFVEKGIISKQERRKITKLAKEYATLTERQKLRRAVKEKKALPKLTSADRKRKYHDEVDKEREEEKAARTVCLGCRKRGHFIKDCPFKTHQNEEIVIDERQKLICYNCGSADHPLRECPKPRTKDGSLPYAKCFICKGSGHISRDCPENPNGLYPKGGCCHICLQKTHLVRDCPERTEEDIQRAKRRREELEEQRNGPKFAGLMADENGKDGGDDNVDFEQKDGDDDDDDDEDDDDDDRKKKKSKKEKKEKKEKKNKKDRDEDDGTGKGFSKKYKAEKKK